METKEKKLSKIGEWMRSQHEPFIDLSVLTVEQQSLFMKRALR